MQDLGEVFSILQTVDLATLALVRTELDRLQREKQNDRRECVEVGAPASRVRGRV
jgi:hypothetical protein